MVDFFETFCNVSQWMSVKMFCDVFVCQWDMDVCGTGSDSSSDIPPLPLPYKLKLRYDTDGVDDDGDDDDGDDDYGHDDDDDEQYLTVISRLSRIN